MNAHVCRGYLDREGWKVSGSAPIIILDNSSDVSRLLSNSTENRQIVPKNKTDFSAHLSKLMSCQFQPSFLP
jgi:hypothetical protein